jgi:uncharacterized protein
VPSRLQDVDKTIIARWQDWSGKGIEHLVLREGPDGIVAESAVVGTTGDEVFVARYRIICDRSWRVRRVGIAIIGDDRATELASDGAGGWTDGGSVASMPQLGAAIDIDLSITPFTNTLPIRRLHLQSGQSEEIVCVYVQFPGLDITTDRQRYTCLEPSRLYRYESLDSDFSRDITVDDEALIVTYPGLFRRLR